jgi:hypothetical protein
MTTIPAKMGSILARDDSFLALFGVEGKDKKPDADAGLLVFISTTSILSGRA